MLEKYGKPSNILQNTSLSDHSVKAKYEGSQTLSHLFIYLEEYYTKSICCFLSVQQIRTQLKCNLNFVKYKLFFFFFRIFNFFCQEHIQSTLSLFITHFSFYFKRIHLKSLFHCLLFLYDEDFLHWYSPSLNINLKSHTEV